MKITKKQKIIISLFVSLITLLILTCFILQTYAYSNSYVWSSFSDLTTEVSNNLISNNTDDTSNSLNLDCGSCILIEQSTGQILYSYNSHEALYPASVTKIMSIYLIMEAIQNGKINYDTKIPCSENAESMGGSQIWLTTTENLTVDEMLKAICVVSANDCITALAEYIGGTEENFVNMMNEKAKELGMNDTCFKNCHGIDEDGHVMSAYDIAILSRELLNKYPEITKYTTIYMDSLRDGKSSLVNTNKLVRTYSGCTGLKTGSTSKALYNLSASATRDGLSLIAVVMKAPTSKLRFSNASSLLDYGFTNFEFKVLANANDKVKEVNINKGTTSQLNAIYQDNCGTIIQKGNDVNIDKKISLKDSINAPISKGDVIGNVEFTLNDQTIATTPIISDTDVPKLNLITMSTSVLKNWFKLLR